MKRSNSILNHLFANSVHSIRRLASSDSEAKVMYRFLQNDRVSEDDIIKNMSSNCINCVGARPVLYIQDTSDVNLYNHKNRIKKGRLCWHNECGCWSSWISYAPEFCSGCGKLYALWFFKYKNLE